VVANALRLRGFKVRQVNHRPRAGKLRPAYA
jgi:hypothetical protein